MKQKWISLIVFLSAIITGVFYCLYLQNDNINFFKTIYMGILSSYKQEISNEVILELFMNYIKKMCMVFLMGSFSVLVPLGFVVMFIIVFSYGFTIGCFVVLYGLKGAVASFLLYGIQGIIVIISGFYILNYKREAWEGHMKIAYIVGMVFVGISIMVGFDLIGILNFDLIKTILL